MTKNEKTEYWCPSIQASWIVMGFVFLCLGVIHFVGLYPDKMIRWVWFGSLVTALASMFGIHCAWILRLNKYKKTDYRDSKYWSPSITLSWILFGIGTLYSVLLMLSVDWEDRDTQFLSLFSYMAGLSILYGVHAASVVSSKSNSNSKSSSKTEKKDFFFELIMWSILIVWAGSFISFFVFVIKPLFFIIPSKVFWGLVGIISWGCSVIIVGHAIPSGTEEKTMSHRDRVRLTQWERDHYIHDYIKGVRNDTD